MAAGTLRVTLRGPDGAERDVSFDGDIFRIGRARDCDLPLDSGYVSRYHARIEWRDDGWAVADEGSKNGVYVNGQRIQGNWGLQPGDSVRVGDYTLVVDPLQADYDRTLALPYTDRQARERLNQAPAAEHPEAAAEDSVSVPAASQPAPGVAAAMPALELEEPDQAALVDQTVPVEEPDTGEHPPVTGRVRIDDASRRAYVNGQDVSGTAGERGFRLLASLAGSADGLDEESLVDSVWGAGRADVEMLERLVARMTRDLGEPDLFAERPEGGYRLAEPVMSPA